jgi:excisionase family DNA binding protein
MIEDQVAAPPPYRTIEVAERWGVAEQTVTAACRRGRIPGAFKVGGKLWLIPRASVAAVERGETAPAE